MKNHNVLLYSCLLWAQVWIIVLVIGSGIHFKYNSIVFGGSISFSLNESWEDPSWYDPRYTHTMYESLPKMWSFGKKVYPIRDLMGRKI